MRVSLKSAFDASYRRLARRIVADHSVRPIFSMARMDLRLGTRELE
jgi:hypothetical protein